MKFLQVIFLCLIAAVAQSSSMAVSENLKETVQANFTVIATLPKSRSIGARNKITASTFVATWPEAIAYCFSTSSVFISISDHIIDESIRQGLISTQQLNIPMWTSGRFSYTGEPLHLNTYMWAGNGRQVVYTNWDTIYGHPKTDWEFETCVSTIAKGYLDTQYVWQTDNCSVKKRFLCLA